MKQVFAPRRCTITSRSIFAEITNKDLWVKKDGKKRIYKKICTVALNNKNGKSITERPKEANDRTEQGHWEIDLVVGKKGTKPVILTLVERKTRKSLYVLVKNKTQTEVIAAIERARRRVGGNFDDVIKTITADNGSEFLDRKRLRKLLNVVRFITPTHIAVGSVAVMRTATESSVGLFPKVWILAS